MLPSCKTMNTDARTFDINTQVQNRTAPDQTIWLDAARQHPRHPKCTPHKNDLKTKPTARSGPQAADRRGVASAARRFGWSDSLDV